MAPCLQGDKGCSPPRIPTPPPLPPPPPPPPPIQLVPTSWPVGDWIAAVVFLLFVAGLYLRGHVATEDAVLQAAQLRSRATDQAAADEEMAAQAAIQAANQAAEQATADAELVQNTAAATARAAADATNRAEDEAVNAATEAVNAAERHRDAIDATARSLQPRILAIDNGQDNPLTTTDSEISTVEGWDSEVSTSTAPQFSTLRLSLISVGDAYWELSDARRDANSSVEHLHRLLQEYNACQSRYATLEQSERVLALTTRTTAQETLDRALTRRIAMSAAAATTRDNELLRIMDEGIAVRAAAQTERSIAIQAAEGELKAKTAAADAERAMVARLEGAESKLRGELKVAAGLGLFIILACLFAWSWEEVKTWSSDGFWSSLWSSIYSPIMSVYNEFSPSNISVFNFGTWLAGMVGKIVLGIIVVFWIAVIILFFGEAAASTVKAGLTAAAAHAPLPMLFVLGWMFLRSFVDSLGANGAVCLGLYVLWLGILIAADLLAFSLSRALLDRRTYYMLAKVAVRFALPLAIGNLPFFWGERLRVDA